ncbi:hypothetical protein [Galactobacter caseinivorans]|uniref:Uncharacterized protein n=1 Tax=Galactobacter caseinivorans TaxID=2676123 RepID=A0A496PFT9_9MICC|nr:hypothetical protein [Galactobacter caseinivorans]RKW69556.1 hypothetical protein DWQ67_12185 [Galactobacter caseinivorans]
MPGPQNDDDSTPHRPDAAEGPELPPVAPPVPPPSSAAEEPAEADDATSIQEPTALPWGALMSSRSDAAPSDPEPLTATDTPVDPEPATQLVSTSTSPAAASALSPVPARTPGTAFAVTEEDQASTHATRKRIAIIAGAVVVALAIGLFVFFQWLQPKAAPRAAEDPASSGAEAGTGGTPADAVTKLGTALKAGDAKTALALLDFTSVTATGGTGHPLLEQSIYKAAKDRPTALEIDPDSLAVPSAQAKTAMVTATATQAGKSVPLTLNLTREAPSDPWKISLASLPSIELSDAGGSTLKVNGEDVKLPGAPDDYTTQRLFVLPGEYSLERKDDKYTEYPKAKTVAADVAALSSESTGDKRRVGSLSFKGKHNKAFKKDATKVVNAWLDKCVASTDMAPAKCPFSAPTTYQGAAVTAASWELTIPPKLSFSDDGTGETTVDGTGGTAKVAGTAKIDGEDTAVRGTVSSFGFKGDLVVKDNKLKFTYRG